MCYLKRNIQIGVFSRCWAMEKWNWFYNCDFIDKKYPEKLKFVFYLSKIRKQFFIQTGILRTPDEDYVIEPHSQEMQENPVSRQPHIMYKRSTIAKNTPHFYDSQSCKHIFTHTTVMFASELFFSLIWFYKFIYLLQSLFQFLTFSITYAIDGAKYLWIWYVFIFLCC